MGVEDWFVKPHDSIVLSPLSPPKISSPHFCPNSYPSPYAQPHLPFPPPSSSLFFPPLSAFSHTFSPPFFYLLPPHSPCFHNSSGFATPLWQILPKYGCHFLCWLHLTCDSLSFSSRFHKTQRKHRSKEYWDVKIVLLIKYRFLFLIIENLLIDPAFILNIILDATRCQKLKSQGDGTGQQRACLNYFLFHY